MFHSSQDEVVDKVAGLLDTNAHSPSITPSFFYKGNVKVHYSLVISCLAWILISLCCDNKQSPNLCGLKQQSVPSHNMVFGYELTMAGGHPLSSTPSAFPFWDSGCRSGHYLVQFCGEAENSTELQEMRTSLKSSRGVYTTFAHIPLMKWYHRSKPHFTGVMMYISLTEEKSLQITWQRQEIKVLLQGRGLVQILEKKIAVYHRLSLCDIFQKRNRDIIWQYANMLSKWSK